MDDKFYIKDGSFCFIIPFFTKESDICDQFFQNLKEKRKEVDANFSGDEKIKEKMRVTEVIKNEFVQNIKNANFPFIQTNFSCRFCNKEQLLYKRKHLCQCVSSAVKFHDDISQKNDSTQLYLDHYSASYSHNDVFCEFDFNVILYINHDNEGKISYVVIEINAKNIKGNLFSNVTPDDTLDPEYIIFIKHLFYKRKMTLDLLRKGSTEKKECCLQNWATDYMRKLCVALGVSYHSSVPDYVKNAAFRYSFIELKELRGSYNQPVYFDFDDTGKFLETHSHLAYGLLLSDEGWRAVPKHITTKKLQDYWFTRKFSCTFFLQHNALLFNLKNSKDGKAYSKFGQNWFSKYKDDKYADYITSVPCLTGIDTLAIFVFLKSIAKQVYIDKYRNAMGESEEELSFVVSLVKQSVLWSRSIIQKIRQEKQTIKVSRQLIEARNNLELLTRILNSPSFMLGEIKGMEECIYRQFGIIDTIKYVKEIYQRQSDKLHFSYEINNNNTIKILTILTAVIGLSQVFRSLWFSITVLVAVISTYIYYGVKYKWFKNKDNDPMKNDWIDKEIIYQVFVDRFAGFPETKENGNIFMGGNLRGVIDRLDYLQDMGITTLWLSPIYCTANYHGYHATDFMNIDPRFGTMKDLAELIESVHKRNMKILVDFVPNHCSINHPFFQDALHNKDSKYRDWFYFNKKNEYTCFLKYKELPKINLDNREARKYMINVARFWCANSFDGLRIDHAVGPSFDFWDELMSTMRKEFPDKIFFGEVWCKGIKRQYYKTLHLKRSWIKYLFGIKQESFQRDYIDVLDGILDFRYREILIDAIEKGERILNNPQLEARVKRHFSKYPSNFKLLLFLDNHDTDRFLFHCKGDKSLLLEAIEFSCKWDKAFILYYGTEQGMKNSITIFDGTAYADLRVREPMNWDMKKEETMYDSIAKMLKKKTDKQ